MISTQQKAIVKATVPALELLGETITRLFYSRLFQAHPELLNVFNPANQRDGGQQRSLAAAVLMYAKHIENPLVLAKMLERIESKHVSLEVRAEHYPIVGEHLLGAIREVLGSAATPEILDAWAAAYNQLATLMTQGEAELYASGTSQPYGWPAFKPFRVQKKFQESEVMTSFYLEPMDGCPLPAYLPGQYLSLKCRPAGSDYEHIRQYSLSCCSNGKYYRISVQREVAPSDAVEAPVGVVSKFLHDEVLEGDELSVHLPAGDFVLNNGTSPVVLLSGGSGITAVLSILEYLVSPAGGTREVLFIHATRGRARHAFGDHLRALRERRPGVQVLVLYEEAGPDDREGHHYHALGRISAELLQQHLPEAEAEFYYCGPIGFMGAIEACLNRLNISPVRRHSEAFGPDPSFRNFEPVPSPSQADR